MKLVMMLDGLSSTGNHNPRRHVRIRSKAIAIATLDKSLGVEVDLVIETVVAQTKMVTLNSKTIQRFVTVLLIRNLHCGVGLRLWLRYRGVRINQRLSLESSIFVAHASTT